MTIKNEDIFDRYFFSLPFKARLTLYGWALFKHKRFEKFVTDWNNGMSLRAAYDNNIKIKNGI